MSHARASFEPRLRLLRRLAWGCAALMLVTITMSAYMRLTQAGLGCTDWPACYAQGLRADRFAEHAAVAHGVAWARLAHRVAASATLVLVLLMVMIALLMKPVLKRPGALVAALLGLASALAALGIATPGARLPAVAMGNLLGGFVMLALCVRLARSASASAAPPRVDAWAVLALALLCAQLAGGALVSTSYAALSCSDLADCTRAAAASGWDRQTLNPWREPVVVAAAALPINRGSAFAPWLHQAGAVVVLPVLAWLSVRAWRRGRRRGAALLSALLVAQAVTGLLLVATGLPLPGALLHNLLAALLLATVVRLI